MSKKNILYLLIDAFRFDHFKDPKRSELLAPNISSIIKNGLIKKIVTNGQVTQVATISLFAQRYPLDYGGYSTGIRKFPKSFVELIQKEYETSFIASTYMTGPMWRLERGFDNVENLYDKRLPFHRFINHFFSYFLKKEKKKLITKKKLIQILTEEYGTLLSYLAGYKSNLSDLKIPSCIGQFDKKEKESIRKELNLLKNDPEIILKKIKNVPAEEYFYSLGKTQYTTGILKKLEVKLKFFFSRILSFIFRENITLTINRKTVNADEVVHVASQILKKKKKPWFFMVHIFDLHESQSFSRYIKIIKLIKYIPRVFLARLKYEKTYTKFHDLILCYVDECVGHLLKDINLNNVQVIISGDHGYGWDYKRKYSMNSVWGFKTFYERITIPLILSKIKKKVGSGIHDSMSISATILELLNIKKHSTFLGKSIFKKGNDFCITEAGEPGYADPINHNLHYTITTNKYKLMTKLIKNKFEPLYLFNRVNDPCETKNLVHMNKYNKTIRFLTQKIVIHRKKIINSR